MKTIIVYASKHGTTEKVANILGDSLKDVEVVDVKRVKDYNLRVFDAVIVGGSIHAGNIQSSIKMFCKDNVDLLLEKKLGLFITCMFEEKSKRVEQLNNAFSEELRKHSVALGVLGGEFLFEKMNFMEKLMIKIIAKTSKSKSSIDYDAIKKFVKDFKKK